MKLNSREPRRAILLALPENIFPDQFRMSDFVVVLTGATSGLGLEVARLIISKPELFSKRTIRPVFIGRRDLTHVDEIFNEDNYLQMNLAYPNTTGNDILKFLGLGGHIDMLIHNAAVGYYGQWEMESARDFDCMFQVNLVSPIVITRTLAPALSGGKVVFVSSVVSDLPTPKYAAYTATKAGLTGFAKSFALEVEGEIEVLTVFPGAMKTGFHEKMKAFELPIDKFTDPKVAVIGFIDALHGIGAKTVSWKDWTIRQLAGSTMLRPVIREAVKRKASSSTDEPDAKKQAFEQVRIKRALITGAANGIGKELVLKYESEGYEVVGIDMEKFKCGNSSQAVVLDLTDFNAYSDTLASMGESFDVVILNAGMNRTGRFTEMKVSTIRSILDLNSRSVMRLLLALHGLELLGAHTRFVFVSSLSHFVSYPGASVYAASKDFIASLAYSLSANGGAYPAHSGCVYPGPTHTKQAWECAPDNSQKVVDRRMLPKDVAKTVFSAENKRHQRIVPGWTNWIISSFGAAFPSVVQKIMKRAIYDRLPAKK